LEGEEPDDAAGDARQPLAFPEEADVLDEAFLRGIEDGGHTESYDV
jgi:hypothetical protein